MRVNIKKDAKAGSSSFLVYLTIIVINKQLIPVIGK